MTYMFGNVEINERSERWDVTINHAYDNKVRPLCLCRKPGVPMYIAKIAGRYYIKRMPNTGAHHNPACESFEPPPELSGLGEVMGVAIKENVDSGITTLKLDFSLTKRGGRNAPTPSAGETAKVVEGDAKKLTLRGVLHYLIEQAGFNRWHPGMIGKRNWSVFRRYMLDAANNKETKGMQLSDVLYMPESWSSDRKEEIESRRRALFSKIAAETNPRKLLIAVGEFKHFDDARYGVKLVLKHMPDTIFLVDESLHKKIKTSFQNELDFPQMFNNSHLLAIFTFGVRESGIADVQEITFINLTEHWLPFENANEKILIDKMVEARRSFVKGLRYNLGQSKVLASMTASDTNPATAMYIIHKFDATMDAELHHLIANSDLSSWVWNFVESPTVPALPSFAHERLKN